jgi:hypothetical protein
MSKTFMFAGICQVDSVMVYKFANNANRAAELAKFGATCINMVPLPYEMDKTAAIAYLATIGIKADKAPRVAKVAKVAKETKQPKVATPVTKTRRVGDKPRKGQDPEEFVAEWFADKAAKLAKKAA